MPKTRILTYAGIGSASLLASLPVFLTLAPFFSSPSASAEEIAEFDSSANVGARVAPGLAITAEPVTISAYPMVGNTFVTATSTVNVINNAAENGYHLIMSSSAKNNGALKYGDNVINTFSEYSKTGAQMKAADGSSWGYTLDKVAGTNSKQATNNASDLQKTFYPIPTSPTSWDYAGDQPSNQYKYLKKTYGYTDRTNGDDIVVGYGFSISPSVIAGTYSDTITYTVIPNSGPVTKTLFDMVSMQDLATYPEACAATPTPAVRTGNTPDTAVTASMDKEDFLANYSIGQVNTDKIPTVTLADTRDDNTYQVKKLADGNCWMTQSLKIHGKTLTYMESNVSEERRDEETGFKLPTAVAASDTKNSSTAAYVSYEGVNNTYLYNFYAATAGNEEFLDYIDGKDSPEDICPRGWHLPNSEGNASWNKLFREDEGIYEISTINKEYSNSKVAWGTPSSMRAASGNPLNLQKNGEFLNATRYNVADGFYWTRTANPSAAYRLYYHGGGIFLNGTSGARGCGLRCVSE